MENREIIKIYKTLDIKNKIIFFNYILFSLISKLIKVRISSKFTIDFSGTKYRISIGRGELNTIYHTNLLKDYMQLKNFIPRKSHVCIDVGANIGSTSLSWYKPVTAGKIYAIEPYPRTFYSLKKNIKINEANETIFPKQLAIGSTDGMIPLFVADRGTMAMLPGDYGLKGKEITVKSMCLDSFIKQENLGSVDLMKIDIEGYELEALKGAVQTLEITKRIVLEYHSTLLREECLQILRKNNYHIFEKGLLIFSWKNKYKLF